jgi:biotin carboxyl carrier protein
MKYTIKIADKTYEVEIENIYARPVIAHVDGERVEVLPENGIRLDTEKESDGTIPFTEKGASVPKSPTASTLTPASTAGGKSLTSPLPGTVIEVFVKKGDKVEAGQVVLIIEAMKMKNSIRSVRTGTLAEVLGSAGQTVAHKQALVEFTE